MSVKWNQLHLQMVNWHGRQKQFTPLVLLWNYTIFIRIKLNLANIKTVLRRKPQTVGSEFLLYPEWVKQDYPGKILKVFISALSKSSFTGDWLTFSWRHGARSLQFLDLNFWSAVYQPIYSILLTMNFFVVRSLFTNVNPRLVWIIFLCLENRYTAV